MKDVLIATKHLLRAALVTAFPVVKQSQFGTIAGLLAPASRNGCALGIRKGAPQAVQVADRFHLLVNLRDAMQRVLQRQSNILKDTFRLFNNQESINTEKRQIKQREELQTSQEFPLSNKKASLFTGNVSAQRQFKFETAKDLYAKGYKIKTISKHLNANIKSIRKYVN